MTRSEIVEIDLAKRALVRLESGVLEVDCQAGSLWITQDNTPRDIILSPGQHFIPADDAPMVVYALEPAHMAVRRAHPARPARTPSRSLAARLFALG